MSRREHFDAGAQHNWVPIEHLARGDQVYVDDDAHSPADPDEAGEWKTLKHEPRQIEFIDDGAAWANENMRGLRWLEFTDGSRSTHHYPGTPFLAKR